MCIKIETEHDLNLRNQSNYRISNLTKYLIQRLLAKIQPLNILSASKVSLNKENMRLLVTHLVLGKLQRSNENYGTKSTLQVFILI